MRSRLLIFLFALTHQLSALEVDSTKRAEMIAEGRMELCNLIEYNSHAAPLDRKFLVVIDGNPLGVNYTLEKNIGANNADILDEATVNAINDTIAAAYAAYNIEMYVIVMKSFDLIFKADLPAYPSAKDIFTTRLYDETSNINMLRATHQDLTYSIAFGTAGSSKDYFIYSRAEYKGVYKPNKVGVWNLTKLIPFHGTTSTYPKLNELINCFDARTINDPAVMQAGLQVSVKASAARFYETAKYMATKGAIMTTFTTQGMSDIFEQLKVGVDYEGLTEAERRRALSVFAGFSMGHNGIESEELYACRIIEFTPAGQVPEFLDHLSQVSELNSFPSYQGDKPNKALIVVLIGRMDDVGSGGDNYKRMIKGLTTITLSSAEYVNSHLPTTDQQWMDCQIFWDESYNNLTPPIGTHEYAINLADEGTIQTTKNIVKGYDYQVVGNDGTTISSAVWETYPRVDFSPFDLVIITNRSSLVMIAEAGVVPEQPYLAPAIMLEYCDDKEFNSEAVTTTAIIFSAIGVLTGPASILGAIEAGNVALAIFEGLQFVGASADLVANAVTSNQFKEAVNVFNLIVGVWGITRVGVSSAKYTLDYLAGVKSGNINPVPIATAEIYCSRYDAITSWNNVDEVTREEMRRMREILGRQVNKTALLNFVAHTASELNAHLQIISPPVGVSYSGPLYRSLSITSETNFGAVPTQMTDHHIYSSWGRYDLQGEENAMYLSKTLSGNQTEISPHYGPWTDYSTYVFENVQADNLLDLTQESVRQQLGVNAIDLVRTTENALDPNAARAFNYELTNVIAKWAREQGYNGLVVPGARGAQNYTNVVLFEQQYIDGILANHTAEIIVK